MHYDLLGRNIVLEQITPPEPEPEPASSTIIGHNPNSTRYRLVLIDFAEARSLRSDAGESTSLQGLLKHERLDVFGVLAGAFGRDMVIEWIRGKMTKEKEKDGTWRACLVDVCKFRKMDVPGE